MTGVGRRTRGLVVGLILVACGRQAAVEDAAVGPDAAPSDDAGNVSNDAASSDDAAAVTPPDATGDGAHADASADASGTDAGVDAAADASPITCADYGPAGRQVAAATLASVQQWQVDARLALAERPRGLAVAPTNVLYGADDAVVALDRVTLVEKTRAPASAAWEPLVLGNTVYAEETFTGEILTFDATTLAPGASVTPSSPPASRASGLAAIPDDATSLYWATSNSTGSISEAHVIDLATNTKSSYSLPVGVGGVSGTTAFRDPKTGHRLIAIGGARPNTSLLIFDVEQRVYTFNTQIGTGYSVLSGIEPSGDGCRLYLGMFQDDDNLQIVDPAQSYVVVQKLRFPPGPGNFRRTWVNTLSLAVYGDLLLVLNDANGELAVLNRFTGDTLRLIQLIPLPGDPFTGTTMDSGKAALRVVDGKILILNARGKELLVINAPLQ